MLNSQSMFRADQVQTSGSGGDATSVVLMFEPTDPVYIHLEADSILDESTDAAYNSFSGFLYAEL